MEVTSDYNNRFDPEWFLDTYFSSIDSGVERGNTAKFVLDTFHVFATEFDIGPRLLDVGTGPNIYSILSASRRVDSIHLSDFTRRNLDVLRQWKDGQTAKNIKLVEYEMKLANDSRPIAMREQELRAKVMGIHEIDLTQPNVFMGEKPAFSEYDVITTSLCLDSVSQSTDVYKKAVYNVYGLLKRNGHLMQIGCIEGSFYRVGDTYFPNTYLTASEIKMILHENDFELLKWTTLFTEEESTPDSGNDFSDYKNLFGLVARKK